MRIGVVIDGLGPGLKRGIEFASQLGVDCIEASCGRGGLRPRDFSTSARRDLRNFIARKGLALAALGADLERPLTDAEANNRNIPDLAACLEFARDVGANLVGVRLGGIPDDKDDPRRAAALEALSDLRRPAERHGVLLAARAGVEPAEALAGFLDSAALPFVKAAFDPAEFALRGWEVAAAVECLANWIVHAYARDAKVHATECAVGSGDVPWPEYLAALSGIDHTGPIVIAPPSGPGAREAAARAAEFLRRF